MNTEELKIKLTSLEPSLTFDEAATEMSVLIEPLLFRKFAQQLVNDAELRFDYLYCVTGVDWKTYLTMVYHFESTVHRHIIVVKSNLNRENPEIESVCDIWRTAEFHERECYDLFGIRFINHPDLRRLFLTDDYTGWPLRKDFEDEVNMIKL